MSKISVDVSSARIPVLQVGYQGENEVTDVLFDISSWIAEFGEGVAQLRVKRPGNSEDESYVLSLIITDEKAVWTVSETDTANKGSGKVQLSYMVGNIVKKAVIYPYKVGKSIVGADSPVDPFDSWIERSKAWAIGETLDGYDVPETDETYQNNAKYYAEQANILGSAQVVLAAEQVTLAAEQVTLATEKADAAAASEAAVNGVSTQLKTRMSAIETEQAVQDARMDTFVALPEGSTTGNAELADIRVGADGTTYDTAGNAVRGQISELKSDLNIVDESLWQNINVDRTSFLADYVINSILGTTLSNQGTTVTDFIYLGDYEAVCITVFTTNASSGQAGIAFYDDSKNYVKGVAYTNASGNNELKQFKIDSGVKYLRTCFKTDEATYGAFEIKGFKQVESLIDDGKQIAVTPTGSINAFIDSSGVISPSSLTKTFYAPSKLAKYLLERADNGNAIINAFCIAEFNAVPSVGLRTNNYNYDVNAFRLELDTELEESYVAWCYATNTSADNLKVTYSDLSYLNKSIDSIKSSIAPLNFDDADIPSVPIGIKVEGYYILADGTIVENSNGYYLRDINVEEEKTYKIKIHSDINMTTNIRVHGYDGATWVEQIELFAKVEQMDLVGEFTVPANSNINNIRISSGIGEHITLKPANYTIIDYINDKSVFDGNVEFVNMGNPYTYLSAPIEDEILDSTDVDDVYAIYDALVTNYPQFIKRMPDIGYDESGLPMRLYRVGWQEPWLVVGNGNEASWSDANNIYSSEYDYQKLFVNAGTHGNEKSSVYGVALSIQEIVTSQEPWALYLRGNFMIDVCPVANPWGYNNTSRNGYGDVNINRDFLTRTRSESQAIYNLLKDGGYYACIDSHNSGGDANYFGITDSNPLLKIYVQMNMKLAGIVYDSWDTLASGDVYAVKPYMQCWISEPLGTLHDLFNELGVKGYLIEAVGVYKGGIGILTPNHKKYCKFTKDLLINSLIALGSTNWE